ncbi:MAG TPA: TetR/AcrR family transcriptional regulator [Actinospica sp.]|nr:TetR/AcrR family transcriptional regulator [Actinospica sp.]
MATQTHRTPRRTEALSRERIVETAVDLLDTAGEGGLTFKALTERLATGPGAIYHHVANKEELLGAATDALVTTALATEPAEPSATPQDVIRAVALGLFDAIDEHPWLTAQLSKKLSHSPWGTVAAQIFERVGQQVHALGAPDESLFTATSALVHYILGAAGQNAANARGVGAHVSRAEFLDTVATAWQELDPDEYPFAHTVARQLRDHDDREQYLAGIDLILRGITRD